LVHNSLHILLVDDHHILREGLKTLLEKDSEVVVVAMAGTAQEGLTKAIGSNVQVAIIDLSLPDHDGIWLLQQIRLKRPDLPVIILSMHSDQETVVKALGEGAAGYLTKSADSAEVLNAIRAVHRGGSYLQPQVAHFLLGALRNKGRTAPPAELSDREQEILRRVAEGQSNRHIAEELFVSPSTVKAQLRGLFRELQVSTRTEVVVEAMRRGLIQRAQPA
jgi:DNA-binding NarL/FixJ family response regulator